jgi:hypothetical protein
MGMASRQVVGSLGPLALGALRPELALILHNDPIRKADASSARQYTEPAIRAPARLADRDRARQTGMG